MANQRVFFFWGLLSGSFLGVIHNTLKLGGTEFLLWDWEREEPEEKPMPFTTYSQPLVIFQILKTTLLLAGSLLWTPELVRCFSVAL